MNSYAMTDTRTPFARLLAAWGVAFIVMGVLDGLWLGWLALGFYQRELGPLMTDSVRIVPAALYYLFYPAAIVFLALTPRPAQVDGEDFVLHEVEVRVPAVAEDVGLV